MILCKINYLILSEFLSWEKLKQKGKHIWLHQILGSCGFQLCGFPVCTFSKNIWKIAQISSLCNFHYKSEEIPSLMWFCLLVTSVLPIWLLQIFARPKKRKSQGPGVIGVFVNFYNSFIVTWRFANCSALD